MCNLADLLLLHFAEWHQRPPELRLPQAKQKIRLIFARIDALAKNRTIIVMLDDRVMTGRDVIAAQCCSLTPEVSELDLLVAHHTRIRRPASPVFAGEIINH